jgi:O-antigen ligase
MRILLRLALVPLVAALVLAGIWVAGGVLTNDFRLAMPLTALWLAAVGLAALAVAWRWRALALPVLARLS